MSTSTGKKHLAASAEQRGADRHPPKRRTPRTRQTLRKRSNTKFLGLPLWELARGPDPAKGEVVGHARAIIAVGDIADGVLAVGRISRGVIVVGGLSLGVFSLGGVSIGLVAALGGVAVAPLAMGGVAIGLLALGGAGCELHGRLHHQPQSALSGFLASIPSFARGDRDRAHGRRAPNRMRRLSRTAGHRA
jgi:hypothetical protein